MVISFQFQSGMFSLKLWDFTKGFKLKGFRPFKLFSINMKIYITFFFTIFILLLNGCNETIGDVTSTTSTSNISKTSVLLPLYSYPTDWESNVNLTNLISDTDGQTIAIINPNNGAGLSQNTDYIAGIDYLYAKNVKIIGYVYTSYGARSKQDIYDDIDSYISFYGVEKLSGIFFDEVSLNSDINQTFVKDISSYARDKGLEYITLNPGTTIEQSIIDENYYNLIVTYENPYEKYKDFKNSLTSSTLTKQSLLVYNYPNLTSYSDEIQKAKDMNFDYIYLTTDTDPNPWDSVFDFL